MRNAKHLQTGQQAKEMPKNGERSASTTWTDSQTCHRHR